MEFSYLNRAKLSNSMMREEMPVNSSERQNLAVGFVNFQYWEEPFDVEEAFKHATIFPSLVLPFERAPE